MARLWLVRHGRATAGWGDDPDPGLDDVGRAQAAAVAERLEGLEEVELRTSPLLRTRETAAPLAARWDVEPSVDPAVGELRAPAGLAAGERVDWLRGVLGARWRDLGPDLAAWRDERVAHVAALEGDAVVVTHFVLINAVIGAATGEDRVACRPVGNGSITVVDVGADGELELVAEPSDGDAGPILAG